jgi:hypothetical protein
MKQKIVTMLLVFMLSLPFMSSCSPVTEPTAQATEIIEDIATEAPMTTEISLPERTTVIDLLGREGKCPLIIHDGRIGRGH